MLCLPGEVVTSRRLDVSPSYILEYLGPLRVKWNISSLDFECLVLLKLLCFTSCCHEFAPPKVPPHSSSSSSSSMPFPAFTFLQPHLARTFRMCWYKFA